MLMLMLLLLLRSNFYFYVRARRRPLFLPPLLPSFIYFFACRFRAPTATLLSVAVFVIVRRGCCSKSEVQGNEKVLKTQQSDASDSGFVLDADIGRDLFCSSGGVSDSGASLAALAEMGGLSPVLEENAEVVTKNPMRAAIANGAQFHSVGADSAKFNSNGGSSKFQSFGGDSSKFTSSLGGDSSRREEVEDDEGGGMFADADVVAVLAAAAAAAQQVGKEGQDQVVVKKSSNGASRRGWYQGTGGSWVKSPSWNGENAAEAVTVEQASNTSCASTLEEKAPDAANDTTQVPRSSAVDWMISTRKSFDKDASREAGWLGTLKNARDTVSQQEKNSEVAQSPEIVAALTTATTIVSTAGMADEKNEYPGGGRPTTSVAPTSGGKATTAAVSAKSQAPFPSPQMVDGISARAFGQAEIVAEELPALTTGRGAVSEPECEVPKPAPSGTPTTKKKKFGEYSWLSSSGRNLKEMAKKAEANEAEHARVKTPLLIGSAAPVAPAQRALKGSTTSSGQPHKAAPTAGGSASAASRKAASVLPTETAIDLPTATTTPGSIFGRGQTPTPEAEQHETAVLHLPLKVQSTTVKCPPLTPVGDPNGVFNSTACSSPSPKKPSRLAPLATPDRSSRVSQVVEAFEKLTPKVRAAAVTPGAYTPGALTPGAAAWTTPVATPDRTPQATVKVPPEEQKVGKERTTSGAIRDRSPKTSAPDSGPGGGTPERASTPDGAFIGGKMGVSPTDERQFAWKLESPAGVDGLPSPTEADLQATTVSHKKGRVIPSILGAADTVATGGTPVLSPSASGSKPRQLRQGMISSGDSSFGAGWGVEPSFGASQVAPFVADAKAEAEAEAAQGAREEVKEEERREEGGDGEEKEKRHADPEAYVVKADGAQLAKSEAPAAMPTTPTIASAGVVAVVMSPMKGKAVQEVEAAAAVEAVEAAAKAHAEAHAEGYIDGDADTDAGSFVDALAVTPRAALSSSIDAFMALEGGEKEASGLTAGAMEGTRPSGGSNLFRVSTDSTAAGEAKKTEADENRQEEHQERGMGTPNAEREESGEEKKEQEGEETSFHEAAEVAALVAEAMALADDDGNVETALYPAVEGEEEGGAVEAEQVDDYSDDSSERGGRASADGMAFASSKSILTWTEGEDVEDGDAERDAEEVKALVAEALALIKEASEDATTGGQAPGY